MDIKQEDFEKYFIQAKPASVESALQDIRTQIETMHKIEFFMTSIMVADTLEKMAKDFPEPQLLSIHVDYDGGFGMLYACLDILEEDGSELVDVEPIRQLFFTNYSEFQIKQFLGDDYTFSFALPCDDFKKELIKSLVGEKTYSLYEKLNFKLDLEDNIPSKNKSIIKKKI